MGGTGVGSPGAGWVGAGGSGVGGTGAGWVGAEGPGVGRAGAGGSGVGGTDAGGVSGPGGAGDLGGAGGPGSAEGPGGVGGLGGPGSVGGLGGPGGAGAPEPVKQLVGRRVMIVHGTRDQRTDPELSFLLASRAKKANRDVCRFEVHGDGHGLRQYRDEVRALSVNFVLGSLFGTRLARPVADALAAPPPLGLRMPLASGFGRGRGA
ncbi:hypothetical protein JNUCC64_12035 [Streptomyces sp. JNUCC 64]